MPKGRAKTRGVGLRITEAEYDYLLREASRLTLKVGANITMSNLARTMLVRGMEEHRRAQK